MNQRIFQLTSLFIGFSLTRFTFAQVEGVPQHLEAGVTFRVTPPADRGQCNR